MKLHIHGIDKNYVKDTIKKIKKLTTIPDDLELYFIKGYNLKVLLKLFPIVVKPDIKKLIKRGSLSYSLRNKHLIIIQFEDKEYLMKKQSALIGLLLHEIFHTKQRKRDLDKNLNKNYKKFYISKLYLLKTLKYKEKKLKKLFLDLGEYSLLLAKELYTNTEIIKNGLTSYLIEYYKEEFPKTKKCPKPVFYEGFKKAAKKDINVINIALEFEFALLGFVLPFKKLKIKEAKSLVKHIRRCYNINMDEIARKCREITFTYEKDFGKKNFQKEFFEGIFFKVYDLLLE